MTRILFGVLAFVCLALGAVVAFVAVLIVLRIPERSAVIWMGCVLFGLFSTALIACGVNLGKRVAAGENTWKWGFTRGASERLRITGYFMFLSPIWYPLLEESRLRWPLVDDIPFYLFSAVLGVLMIRISGSALAEAEARYERGNRD